MGIMVEQNAAAKDVVVEGTPSSQLDTCAIPTTQPRVPASHPVSARQRPRVVSRVLRAIKSLVLIAEAIATVFLLCYAGIMTRLPASPPVVHVGTATSAVSAAPSFYCWLTPGRGVCAEAGTSASSSLPTVTLRRGTTLIITVSSPPPTSCAAATSNPNEPAAPAAPLWASVKPQVASSLASGYRADVTLAPGSYLLTLICTWMGRPAMRWLDGQGAATYALSLRVTT